MERGQRAKVKGMPLLVCRPKPKRGKRGGSPGAKPKRTTARLLFERKARKDMHGKFGGKEAFASSLHVVDLQITSKVGAVRGLLAGDATCANGYARVA